MRTGIFHFVRVLLKEHMLNVQTQSMTNIGDTTFQCTTVPIHRTAVFTEYPGSSGTTRTIISADALLWHPLKTAMDVKEEKFQFSKISDWVYMYNGITKCYVPKRVRRSIMATTAFEYGFDVV
ncbi:hypothetical protein TNCV_2845121 [Trichonephila clavipes]|nr:hypothetical protein TNCV_2845121 [Trichonephila clavipes]